MKYKYNDGGRKDAGYKGHAGDCVPRAIIIANGLGYRQTRKELDAKAVEMTGGLCQSTQNGTPAPVAHSYLVGLGWEAVPMVGASITEVPTKGTFIISVKTKSHYTCMIDGVINDTWRCHETLRTKNKKANILGYYRKKSPKYSSMPVVTVTEEQAEKYKLGRFTQY